MAPSLQAVSHATSYRTAIDLFYDDTNHTIMFTLTKTVCCTRDCTGVIGDRPNTLMDPALYGSHYSPAINLRLESRPYYQINVSRRLYELCIISASHHSHVHQSYGTSSIALGHSANCSTNHEHLFKYLR